MANFTLPSFPRSPRPTPPRDALAAAVAELRARLDAASVSFPRLSSAAGLHLVDSYADALALAGSLSDDDVVLVGMTSWYYVDSHSLVQFDPSGADARLAAIEALVPAAASASNKLADAASLAGKADLVDGRVPPSQLPSYVDDVLEYDSRSAFPGTGESGKIYVDKATNAVYRWSGSAYVEVSPSRDWTQELAAKRGLTDFSVGDGWLLVKPDGSREFLEWNSQRNFFGQYGGFILRLPVIAAANRWALFDDSVLKLFGSVAAALDADELVIPSDEDASVVCRLYRRSRLAFDSEVAAKEDKSNKTTSLSAGSTDVQYPSAKAVFDALAGKQATLEYDAAPAHDSAKHVKSGGIWGAIWGALSALPTGFSSLYDWCVAQLAGKLDVFPGVNVRSWSSDSASGSDAMFIDRAFVGSSYYDTEGDLLFAGDGGVFVRDVVKVAIDGADAFDVVLEAFPQFNVDGRGVHDIIFPRFVTRDNPIATVGTTTLYLAWSVAGDGRYSPMVADSPDLSTATILAEVSLGNSYMTMDFDFEVEGHRVRMWVGDRVSRLMSLDARVRQFLGLANDGSAVATTAALAGKADLVDGRVPPSQLPSYVDDVLEVAALPSSGESGKLYVVTGTNAVYRWGGSSFVEVSPSRDWSGELARKQDVVPDLESIRSKASSALQAHQDISGKRDLTDLSVDQGKWLLVKPDGTLAWLEKSDPQQATWTGDGFTLRFGEEGGGDLLWFLWKSVSSGWVVDDSVSSPPDANRLEFMGPDDTSVYRLVRGSRLVLDTEIPPAQVNDDAVTPTGANPVKGSGIWGAIWGALAALPTGFASLYDWCVAQLAGKLSTSGGTMTGRISALLASLKLGTDPTFARFTIPGATNEHYMCFGYNGGNFGLFVKNGSGSAERFYALPSSGGDIAMIQDLAGKADAADLRYRIAEAGFKHQFAASAFPITYMDTLTSTPVTITAGDAGDITWDVQPDGGAYVSYNGFDFAYFSSTGDYGGSKPGVDLQFNGVAAENAGKPLVQTVADRTVNLITANDETSIDIEPPEAVTVDGVSYARDFILDVDNYANASDLALEFTGLGVDYAFVPLEDDSVSEMMTIGAGERVRLYFTETPYTTNGSLPVINVARVTIGDFVTSTATQGGN